MPLVPHRFLIRMAYPCWYLPDRPLVDDDRLLDLPGQCRLENFAALDEQRNFAEVLLAWNENGLGVQVEVKGKEKPAQGDAARPRSSDGLTLWLDTRDARTSHRASRYCHQFHFLPTGGGADRDQPAFVQAKINRALQDAPFTPSGGITLRSFSKKSGYLLEVFLSAAALNGYDPDQNPRLGLYYALRDNELGEQYLSVGPDFPYWEDPSLWSVLELVRGKL